MHKILHFILKSLSKTVIAKYQPKVVGITGSVGKTSAKVAIATVLSFKFNTRSASKNFNNEIGIPLTILGHTDSPGKNIFIWLWVFVLAIKLILIKDKNYPEVLVLEMGADKVGDIGYLTSIARPQVAVITAIGSSHIEFFKTMDNIIKEKSSILNDLGKDGLAVINNDDPNLKKTIANCKGKVFTFGRTENSNIKISDINIIKKDKVNRGVREGILGYNIYGTNFKLSYQGSEVPIFLPYVLGWQHANAAASATAVALHLGMNLVDIADRLLEYKAARGRTNLIKGIKNTWIIDDTYNASPQSSKLALDVLVEMPMEGRKIVVMGDMLELGVLTEESHQEVGRELVRLGVDYLFVVGERSRDIARGAKEAGMDKDNIYHFAFTTEAGKFLQERLIENDAVLIKGSRGAKMEQVVYEVMAKPWLAKDLLVGQVVK